MFYIYYVSLVEYNHTNKVVFISHLETIKFVPKEKKIIEICCAKF